MSGVSFGGRGERLDDWTRRRFGGCVDRSACRGYGHGLTWLSYRHTLRIGCMDGMCLDNLGLSWAGHLNGGLCERM